MNNLISSFKTKGLTLSLGLSLILAGCGGDSSSSNDLTITTRVGIIATASDDYASGEVELAAIEESNITASGGYFSGISDIAVNGYGQNYYLLRKFWADQVLKVNVENPAAEVWQASALNRGETGSANPYQLIFVDETKAYLLRYDQDTAWIVDPSATQASEFFKGNTLDLSNYVPADSNGAPGMSSGVVVDGKLFITLQRLDGNFQPTNESYVAVFDTATDAEIETNADENDNLKGIPLIGQNPGGIQHLEGTGVIVHNIGSYSTTNGTSLDLVDPATYTVTSMIGDAEIDTQISDAVIVSSTKGYILNYASFQSISLQSFDPSQGASSLTTVGSFSNADFRDIELSPEGRLWLADARVNNPGIRVINTSDDTEADFVETSLLPIDISFAEINDTF